MLDDILEIILGFFAKCFRKDPEITRLENQNEADKKQAIDMQREPTGSLSDIVNKLPE